MSTFNALNLNNLYSAISNFSGNGSTTASNSPVYISPLVTAATASSTIYYTYLDTPQINLPSGSVTNAYTLYINNAPIISGGGTIANSYSIYINSGLSYFGGQIQSSIATGTAPFIVASTTNVANLNASSINGFTFQSPGPIGSVTPSTGTFTTTASQFINLKGSTSGIINIQPQAIAGTYNFNMPNTAGTNGQVLASGGGGTNPMTWITPTTGTVTSVAMSVPTFLSVSGSPITNSGTLAIGYSGVALPVINGGTGTTTSTGTGSVVLNTSPTLVTPVIGAATGTSLSVTGNVNSGTYTLTGSSSGLVTIQTQANAGTYNFNIPNTAGTSGQVLASSGGGAAAMTWITPTTGTVTSVAMSVPTFLSISGSPITNSGTLAVSYSGVALPVINGGTGTTTSTGTGSVVLSNTPTLVTPVIGAATGTSLSLTGNVNSLTHTLTGSTSGVITIQAQAIAGTYNFNMRITSGTSGQVLTSAGGITAPMTWTTPTTGTVTSVAMSVPSFLSISGSPITNSGTLALSYSGVALPVTSGGTGTTTSTGSGSVVLNNTPTFITPVIGTATGTSLSLTGNINSLTQTLTGSTSGVITIKSQAIAGTYNFNLPTTNGNSGQALISGGGGTNSMSWVTLTTGTVTSVALTVPSFLSVSGSPITSNGTLALGYSGVALPVANGGTGTTTSTGTGNAVLSNTPTLVTPNIGVATGTSLSVTGNVNSGTQTLTGSTSGVVTIQTQAATGTYNLNIPNTSGSTGQYLTSAGGGNAPMTWTTPPVSTYWICSVQYPSGTNGGGMTAEVLTNIIFNNIVSSSVNTAVTLNTITGYITITPGLYYIEANVMGYQIGTLWSIFFNNTSSTTAIAGTTAYSYTRDNGNGNGNNGKGNGNTTTGTTCYSIIKGFITVTTTSTFYIASECSITNTTTGLGVAAGRGTETYTTCTIRTIP
jgi:hypothetical protein